MNRDTGFSKELIARLMPEKDAVDKNERDFRFSESLSEDIVKKYKVLPVQEDDGKLVVAMSEPMDLETIDDLRVITGKEIDPVMADKNELDHQIRKYLGLSGQGQEHEEQETGGELSTVNLVNSIVAGAIDSSASDVHIEPREEKIKVRYRVDGMLRNIMELPFSYGVPVVSRIKIMADLDIAEKRIPQEGRMNFDWKGRDIDLRVSTMPAVFGEKVVIRILDRKGDMFSLEQLGFQEENLKILRNFIKNPYGMILLTGPTGSGKTTTLYTVLKEICVTEKNILTIEDPVECILEGITQTQINIKSGLTFSSGLRSILRQDPDIIMVGEIRDLETAAIAIHAAVTGHLMLSTLHTTDAAGALTRLVDMGVEPYMVASSVLTVVAQRLVRKICPDCRQVYDPLPGSSEYDFVNLLLSDNTVLYRGRGCELCDFTGYKGRISIQEILSVTERVRSVLSRNASAKEIRDAAKKEGMVFLREDGLRKAAQGITTVEEVMRVAPV